MNAISQLKTMAGSPDAVCALAQSASRHLAHGLLVFGVRSSRQPM